MKITHYFSSESWPGYPIGVLLAFGGPPKARVIAALERRGCSTETCLREWLGELSDGILGHCAVLPCQRVVLWFSSMAPSTSTIAHECFHAARGTLPQIGIELTDDTEEVYAYAIGSLVTLIERTRERMTLLGA